MSRYVDISPIENEYLDESEVYDYVFNAPSMDIVHCGKCMYYADTEDYDCEIHSGAWQADDYCSYGERSSE